MTVEEAKICLGEAVRDDGSLYDLGWYLSWSKARSRVVLDGQFTVLELEAIVTYIRAFPDGRRLSEK